jgi:hypothetical protein
MRKILIVATLLAMVLTTVETQAARRQVVQGNGQTVSRGDGPFARLMEIERRKNAALRSMFTR